MTEAKAGAPAGRIVITFPPDLPADPQVSLESVTIGQVAAAAWLLERLAVEDRSQAVMQQAMARAALTAPGKPPALGRS